MIAYVDASVLLRVALGQPDALPDWRRLRQGVASALVTTECLRTLDRLRLRARLRRVGEREPGVWRYSCFQEPRRSVPLDEPDLQASQGDVLSSKPRPRSGLETAVRRSRPRAASRRRRLEAGVRRPALVVTFLDKVTVERNGAG